MDDSTTELYSRDYFEYLQKRSGFRRWVRQFYLHDILKYCQGRTIDFGCGVGELLKKLPAGSIGFEVNDVAVKYCRSCGLMVEPYHPETDDYRFDGIKKGQYSTFTMNHVLEHLDDSSGAIRKIFESCHRIGISRIVFTVPGIRGFRSDKTHVTPVDLDYLKKNRILENDHYRLRLYKYFPVNSRGFSRYFTHNELRLVFDIKQ